MCDPSGSAVASPRPAAELSRNWPSAASGGKPGGASTSREFPLRGPRIRGWRRGARGSLTPTDLISGARLSSAAEIGAGGTRGDASARHRVGAERPGRDRHAWELSAAHLGCAIPPAVVVRGGLSSAGGAFPDTAHPSLSPRSKLNLAVARPFPTVISIS